MNASSKAFYDQYPVLAYEGVFLVWVIRFIGIASKSSDAPPEQNNILNSFGIYVWIKIVTFNIYYN